MDNFNIPLPQETVGNYIKRLRVELKMSQNQLANASGIHLHSLGKIERGITTKLSHKTRRGLARALSIPSEYLEAICNGSDLPQPFISIKFCPQCWIPGTPTEPIWNDIRSLHCFMCGHELISHCLKCGKSVRTFQHSYCPYCGFYYKNTIAEIDSKKTLLKRKKSKTKKK
ncbi:XRE family transcriptional regulator (plasmid) [Calothrix parasitica NIES-267]|uniref:XRE family transcriptional regulator n=1 Tax=Calothrix parasitica NIES-267 TaxID=1973488 RepID=A0A1Z4M376_9CYAN|nr:XRE family transcriptional regulator [Calothrix parasitica NIES-267]